MNGGGEGRPMTRVRMEDFEEGTELFRVYLASTLREAGKVEEALDAAGFDYVVEVETFSTRSILAGFFARRGAGFYVEKEDLHRCADVLGRAGLVKGLVADLPPA
jgi:hypothetical protein